MWCTNNREKSNYSVIYHKRYGNFTISLSHPISLEFVRAFVRGKKMPNCTSLVSLFLVYGKIYTFLFLLIRHEWVLSKTRMDKEFYQICIPEVFIIIIIKITLTCTCSRRCCCVATCYDVQRLLNSKFIHIFSLRPIRLHHLITTHNANK